MSLSGWLPVMLLARFRIVVMCILASVSTACLAANHDKPAEGVAAWNKIYSVLMHPRCLNCHTATDYPQQGDDRHRHRFNVVRGEAGAGVAGFTCAACHQSANADSTGVPGAAKWMLAPRSMAWQDAHDRPLSSPAVARSVASHSHGVDLIKHMEEEPLVLWAFHPGRDRQGTARSLPPLTHAELVAATRAWVQAGMPCPAEVPHANP